MKIQIDGEQLFEVEPWEKKVLEYILPSETLEEDLKRRLEWVLKHKIDQCYIKMETDYIKIIRENKKISLMPLKKEDFVNLVTSLPEYKDRSQIDAENKDAKN